MGVRTGGSIGVGAGGSIGVCTGGSSGVLVAALKVPVVENDFVSGSYISIVFLHFL